MKKIKQPFVFRSSKKVNIFSLIIMIFFKSLLRLGILLLGTIGFLTIIGVHYDSFSTLFKFILFIYFIGLVTDFLIMVFFAFISIFPFKKGQKQFLLFLTDTYCSWIAIHFADYWLDGISIEPWMELLGAIVLASIELFSISKKRKKNIRIKIIRKK